MLMSVFVGGCAAVCLHFCIVCAVRCVRQSTRARLRK